MILVSKKAVAVSLIAIMTLHIISIVEGWYRTLWWIDIVLHFSGGAWTALLFFYIKNRYAADFSDRMPVWFYIILALGFVMLIGSFWELFEYAFDWVFVPRRSVFRAQLGLPDTMGDLVADFLGGLVFSLLVFTIEKRAASADKAINHG